MAVRETMSTGTMLNFQPIGGGRAAVTGDFAHTADEVAPVMRGAVFDKHGGDCVPHPP